MTLENPTSNSAWRAEDYGLDTLPSSVIDSHKMPMDLSGSVWRFNNVSSSASLNFDRYSISNAWLLYSLKRHGVFNLRRISPSASYISLRMNLLDMRRAPSWSKLARATDLNEHETLLNKVMSEAFQSLKKRKVVHRFNRLRQWYVWCSDFLPDLGFLPEEAYKWQLVKVPGGEKGVAVRTSDPNGGPLDDAEVILLRRALISDGSMERVHVQQRAAIWLALIFGRNPANIALLRQGDFRKLEVDTDDLWTLSIPRIKKNALPRTLFKEEYLESSLAKVIQGLLEHGPASTSSDRAEWPLFARQFPRASFVGTPMEQWAWHMYAGDFTALIQSAVERYAIVSPRTGEPLYLTTRRLRYTFATNRVREGISARDLADALDHSDLQHVQVYFDARSTVVERLDRAAALHIAPKLNLFKGRTVKDGDAASLGKNPAKRIRIIPELIGSDHHIRDLGACGKDSFCKLFPPYSCYPCDKFEPFSDSLEVHEMVFSFLLDRRERLRLDPLESSRIAVQLDEVIYACAQVIHNMRSLQDAALS